MSNEAKPEKPAAKPKAKRTKPAASSPIAVDDGIRRRAGRRLGGRVGSVLVLAIVLMANYLAFRHYHRWDWTQDGLFTLSQRSVGVARALEAPLDIYLFLGASEPQHDEIRELLDRYRAESPQIRIHEVDPDRQQAEYRVLADRFNLMQGQASDVAVLVKQGEHTWKITRDDLRDVDMSSIGDASGPTLDVKSEQALTGAILQVTEGRPTKLCLTAGHGEWALGGAGDRDCSAVRDELRRDNVEVETIATIICAASPMAATRSGWSAPATPSRIAKCNWSATMWTAAATCCWPSTPCCAISTFSPRASRACCAAGACRWIRASCWNGIATIGSRRARWPCSWSTTSAAPTPWRA